MLLPEDENRELSVLANEAPDAVLNDKPLFTRSPVMSSSTASFDQFRRSPKATSDDKHVYRQR